MTIELQEGGGVLPPTGEIGGIRYAVDDEVSGLNLQLETSVAEIAKAFGTWSDGLHKQTRSLLGATSSTYVASSRPYDVLSNARTSLKDDVVSGALDVLEGLTLQTVHFEGESLDEADVYNQIAEQIDLDGLLRRLFRESLIYSQVTIATIWKTKTYSVRGRAAPTTVPSIDPSDPTALDPKALRGKRRKKKYTLRVPDRVVVLDPTSVIPVGDYEFGREKLAYKVKESDFDNWRSDPMLSQICVGPYTPSDAEIAEAKSLGIEFTHLLQLRPDRVYRHTLTKADYERFPEVRMESVFPLLDLKEQLRKADRVSLVGVSNHIILIRKGTERQPGTQAEINNLQENVKTLVRLPVIVSDHRLNVDIITPDVTNTLSNEKYDTLDRRIMSRIVGALTVASSGQRNESTLTVGRMVARLLESRRHMLKRFLEAALFTPIFDGASTMYDRPSLAFVPSQVELDNDSQFYSIIQAARARGDLSRETYLEILGQDAAVEMERILNARLSGADAVFQSHTPFDSPANNPNSTLNQNNQNAPTTPGASPSGGPGRPSGGGGGVKDDGGTSA